MQHVCFFFFSSCSCCYYCWYVVTHFMILLLLSFLMHSASFFYNFLWWCIPSFFHSLLLWNHFHIRIDHIICLSRSHLMLWMLFGLHWWFFFQSSHTLCVQSRIDLNSICYYVSIVEHSSIAYLNITLISLRWHEDWFVRKQFQYEKILFFFYFSRHCVHNKYVIPFYLQFPSIVQPFIVIPTSTKGWRLNGAYVEWLQPVMNFLFSIIIQL